MNNHIICYTPAATLPVDKPAPAPYSKTREDFVVVKGSAYIDSKVAEELVEAAKELREWLSAPNGSLSEPMNRMVTASLETRLNRAVSAMEASIDRAERAVEDEETDEESEE